MKGSILSLTGMTSPLLTFLCPKFRQTYLQEKCSLELSSMYKIKTLITMEVGASGHWEILAIHAISDERE